MKSFGTAMIQNIDLLNELSSARISVGPAWLPDWYHKRSWMGTVNREFIREAALQDVREELPHSIMVTIDEFGEREEGIASILCVHATIHVERDTQRAILLGTKARG